MIQLQLNPIDMKYMFPPLVVFSVWKAAHSLTPGN